MTLDIRGSVKNTRKSKNSLVVVDELISNSIDAFLIRQSSVKSELALDITLTVKAIKSDLLGKEYDLKIICKDNGCGLGPDQLKAFLTKDTSYKDDLNIPGIGNCKGSGRVQFFHHFSRASIFSTYDDAGKIISLSLPSQSNRREIDEKDFRFEVQNEIEVGTTVELSEIIPQIKIDIFTFENIQSWFQASTLKQYVLFSMLQRFVGLKSVLGSFQIKFLSDLDGQQSEAVLKASDIPKHTGVSELNAVHSDGKVRVSTKLTVTHYKLDEKDYTLPRNIVGLCAKSAITEHITSRYLKTKTLENNAIDGYFHIILVESPVFDEGVNEQRDGFDKIPEDNNDIDLFDQIKITFEDIYKVLDNEVQRLITPPNWSREKIVEEVGQDYGVSEEMLSLSNTRVTYGDSPASVAKRVLGKLQEKIVDDTASLLSMKEEIKNLEPDSEDFRQKIDDISWTFASSLETVDMANLSQLIVRRSNIIDVLDLAVNKRLNIQKNLDSGERRKDEELIHNIFFPMRKDSHEVSHHDVWLLSEEYHYFDYIASDKPLNRIKWNNTDSMFEEDVDDVLGELLTQISNDNGGCRPDIALFNEEGSVIIVEFKRPGVSLDEHENELIKYATILAAKSKGRFKKFYGYLIGDTINPIGLRGYNPLPGAKGYFTTSDIKEPTTQATIGQLYSELLYYVDIVDRARKRIGVYKERLKLPVNNNV